MSRSGRASDFIRQWRDGATKEHDHQWGVECDRCMADVFDPWEALVFAAKIMGWVADQPEPTEPTHHIWNGSLCVRCDGDYHTVRFVNCPGPGPLGPVVDQAEPTETRQTLREVLGISDEDWAVVEAKYAEEMDAIRENERRAAMDARNIIIGSAGPVVDEKPTEDGTE